MLKDTKISLILLSLFVISLGLGSARLFQDIQNPTRSGSGPRIGVITLDGPIQMTNPGSFVQPSGAEGLIREIQDLQKDSTLDALLIRINSPGGTVGASQELYTAIHTFKTTTDLPVIASIGDIGASGAYWVALAADTIFANPGSMIGSIGVILSSFDFTTLGEKHGIGMNTIKGGLYKDVMSPWREMTPEEHTLLQDMVDNVHTQFIDLLKERRHFDEPKARHLANGQIFSGSQAKTQGLIDHLGGKSSAVSHIQALVGNSGEPVFVRKNRPSIDTFFHLWDFVGMAPSLKELSRVDLQ